MTDFSSRNGSRSSSSSSSNSSNSSSSISNNNTNSKPSNTSSSQHPVSSHQAHKQPSPCSQLKKPITFSTSAIRISTELGQSTVLIDNHTPQGSQQPPTQLRQSVHNLSNLSLRLPSHYPTSDLTPNNCGETTNEFVIIDEPYIPQSLHNKPRLKYKKLTYERSPMTQVILDQLEKASRLMKERPTSTTSTAHAKNTRYSMTPTRIPSTRSPVFNSNSKTPTISIKVNDTVSPMKDANPAKTPTTTGQPPLRKSLILKPSYNLETILAERLKERLLKRIKCKDYLQSGQKQTLFKKPVQMQLITSTPTYIAPVLSTVQASQDSFKLSSKKQSGSLTKSTKFYQIKEEEVDEAGTTATILSESKIKVVPSKTRIRSTTFQQPSSSSASSIYPKAILPLQQQQQYPSNTSLRSRVVSERLDSNHSRLKELRSTSSSQEQYRSSQNESQASFLEAASPSKRPKEELEVSPLFYLLQKYPAVIKEDYHFMKMKSKYMMDPYIELIDESDSTKTALSAEKVRQERQGFLASQSTKAKLTLKSNRYETSPLKMSRSLTSKQKQVMTQIDTFKQSLTTSKTEIDQLSQKFQRINRSSSSIKRPQPMIAVDYNVSDFIFRNTISSSSISNRSKLSGHVNNSNLMKDNISIANSNTNRNSKKSRGSIQQYVQLLKRNSVETQLHFQ